MRHIEVLRFSGALALSLLLFACTKATTATPISMREPAGQLAIEQRAIIVPPPDLPVVNCSAPPAVVCCQALTPSCIACRERGSAIARAWNSRCVKNDGRKPSAVACDPLRPELPCTPSRAPMKASDLE